MAQTEVQMPDGTVLSFPEGMAQSEIQEAAGKWWAANGGSVATSSPQAAPAPTPAPPPPPPPAPSPMAADNAVFAMADPSQARRAPTIGDMFGGPPSGPAPAAPLPAGVTPGGIAATPDLLRGMTPEQQEAYFRDNPLDRSRAQAANVVQGLPFIGSRLDELAGKVYGEERREEINARDEAFDAANPVQSALLNIGGALTTAPIAIANAGRILGSGSLLSKVLRGATAGAGLGAAEGAIYGSGEGEDGDGSRADNAMQGAAWGAALGGPIGALVPAAGTLARSMFDAAAGRRARAAARDMNVRSDVARLVGDLVRADGATATRNIEAAGDTAILGNLGPSTRAMLDTVGNAPGEASAIARTATGELMETAQGRFQQTLDDVLGPVRGPREIQAEVMQGTSQARRDAYDAAFSRPIDYAADTGRAIEDVLQRIDPRVMREAVEEANAQMRDQGIRNQQIMATINDAGEVTFTQMPDVRQLNALKQALDSVAEGSKDSITGRLSPQGARAARQAQALRNAIGDAVPEYRDALRLGGDTIAERNAVDVGRTMLSARTTQEDFAQSLSGLDDSQLLRVRQGVRGEIDRLLSRVSRGADFDEGEVKELQAAFRYLNTGDARAKMEMLLGDQAEEIGRVLDEAGQAFRARITAGSPTQPRQEMAARIQELLPGNAMRTLETEGPAAALNQLAAGIARTGGQSVEEATSDLNAYLARILTQRGNTADRARQFSEFADLGDRAVAGANTAERVGRDSAAAALPSFASGGTRPEANMRPAQVRRLADMGYTTEQIAQIVMSGQAAIDAALYGGARP